ncbi:hypothetical protein J6590_018697, partial [Homalodisca vitripennis]
IEEISDSKHMLYGITSFGGDNTLRGQLVYVQASEWIRQLTSRESPTRWRVPIMKIGAGHDDDER